MAAEQSNSGTERRAGSKLEVEDPQFCKECGMEIEVDTDQFEGLRWDYIDEEWVEIEKCAACHAEDLLRQLSHIYETDVAFRATVRGLDVETKVIR